MVAYLMKDLYITVFIWLDIRKTSIGRKNLTLSRVCHKIAQYVRPSSVSLNIVQLDSAYHIILGIDQDKLWRITGHEQNLGLNRIFNKWTHSVGVNDGQLMFEYWVSSAQVWAESGPHVGHGLAISGPWACDRRAMGEQNLN